MKKMYSLNDIGAQLGLPSREAPGPRGRVSNISGTLPQRIGSSPC